MSVGWFCSHVLVLSWFYHLATSVCLYTSFLGVGGFLNQVGFDFLRVLAGFRGLRQRFPSFF